MDWSNGPSNQEWYDGCAARDRLVTLALENGVDTIAVNDDPQSVATSLSHLVSAGDREWLESVFDMKTS